jgi:Domain of unknown function (DUF6265)
MHLRTGSSISLVILICSLSVGMATRCVSAQDAELRALDGEWTFVEDLTEGRTLEQMTSPMSTKFSMRVEEGAIVLNGHGSGHRDVRVALDGSVTEIVEPKSIARYTGKWKDGTFEYEVAFERKSEGPSGGLKMIRRKFKNSADGLLVTVEMDPQFVKESIGLYRHAEDIPMPTPAKALIADLAWISGDWTGTKTTGSAIEERWSPVGGGAMLAISRSVNKSGKMFAFEYLRIVERDGGLVYVAQPGGAKPTEFVLTELSPTRAVFENPRHDYPKRIMYELSSEGRLTTTVGFTKGGTPMRVEFDRESKK